MFVRTIILTLKPCKAPQIPVQWNWSPKTMPSSLQSLTQMLAISLRSAYNFCNTTGEFRVLRVGGSIRIPKDSFDAWLFRAA